MRYPPQSVIRYVVQKVAMEPERPTFTPEALAILDRMPFLPNSVASYDAMSGGLVWPDEFPPRTDPAWAVVRVGWLYRYLLGYRASITIGPDRPELQFAWQQVVDGAPFWPGLHPERRGEAARRRLLAAKRREARCLSEVE